MHIWSKPTTNFNVNSQKSWGKSDGHSDSVDKGGLFSLSFV